MKFVKEYDYIIWNLNAIHTPNTREQHKRHTLKLYTNSSNKYSCNIRIPKPYKDLSFRKII